MLQSVKKNDRQPSALGRHDHPFNFSSDNDACGGGPPNAEHDHPETESDATVKVATKAHRDN